MSDYITGGENLQQPEINAAPTTFRQKLENLPDEILSQRRFFKCRGKIPFVTAWSNPDNQQFYSDINLTEYSAGFDTTGHGRADDYCLIDFDHVLDDDGNFVNADAEKMFKRIIALFGSACFVERSISGHGLHIIIKPTPGKFDTIANGKSGVLYFDKETDCKVELFYRTKGRHCLLTGAVFQCQPKAPIIAGDKADAVLQLILDEIKARQPKPTPARATEKISLPQAAQIDSLDYDLFRAEHMLDTINPADLADSDWLAVMSACKNIGIPYSVVDSFNQRDPNRYNAEENQTRWDSLDDSSFDIATLHGIANRFGYDAKETFREFYRLHPELAKKASHKASHAAQAALNAFDEEKHAAIEKLRSCGKFDSETVFADDIVQAAAFACAFDKKAFSDFKRDVRNYGNKHTDEKADVTVWGKKVKEKAAELEKRRSALVSRKNVIDAQIKNQNFLGKNSSLADFNIPNGYAISAEYGIEKVAGEDVIPVCRRPVFISGKTYCADEKIYKLALSFMTQGGKWKKLSPTEKAVVFNKNKIVDLANSDFPVTTSNAKLLVDYLDAFNAENESALPLTYLVNRCGWYHVKSTDLFIDPRRKSFFIQDDGEKIPVEVDEGRSDFAKHLKQHGEIEKWKDAYKRAKKFPVARFIVAAAVAPFLLKILGVRNFLMYICAPTRAGKTTALLLGASAIGDEKIIRSFDATKNGLAGAAADVNDYAFLIDEKQVADNRLKDTFDNLVYALANGIGRTKLNRDSTLKKLQDWRTIAIMTGETQMLADNVTAGAFTRLLTVNAPKIILPADVCKIIRDAIKDNNGLVLPLVIDKAKELGEENLRGAFKEMVDFFTKTFPNLLPEYCEYIACITLADTLLNSALFGNTVTTDDGKTIKARDDAIINAGKIFPLIPTKAEIDDTQREKDFVLDFVAQNQPCFIGGTKDEKYMPAVFGKLCNDDDSFTYITLKALKDACDRAGFDYRKLVADLVADGFFMPADKTEKGHKTPLATVQHKIGKTNARCYRIPKKELDGKGD